MPAHGAAPLRHRPEDPLEVDLVVIATLAIEGVGIHLPGEQENGDRVGPALGDARQGVGRARAGGRADDPGLSRHPRIAVGGEGAGLLVANQRCADRAGPANRIVDRGRVGTRHPKKMPHAPMNQSVHQQIRAVFHVTTLRRIARRAPWPSRIVPAWTRTLECMLADCRRCLLLRRARIGYDDSN